MNYPELEKLISVIEKLRDPIDGCPWDLKQTHKSLTKYLIEEAYEFIDGVSKDDDEVMKDELGDVLLQVILHAQVAKDRKSFNIEDVSKNLSEKLIRRHPHIFEKKDKYIDADGVLKKWVEIKKEEKKGKVTSTIDDSVLIFPSLFSANKIGEKTNRIKFDWSNWQEVLEVVESEWSELKEELKDTEKNKVEIEEEMGDFLFSVAQLARHLKINPEEALREANKKFLKRFQDMEQLIIKDEKELSNMDQMQMDVYWNKVKELEKKK